MAHVLKRKPCAVSVLALLKICALSKRRTSVDYSAVFEQVEARTEDTLAWLSELGKRALGLAEELSRLPDEPARRRRVHELARAGPWTVAASLLGLASRLAHADPARAGALAELAIVAAGEIPPGAPTSRSELLGRAQALLGETLSHARRLAETEEAFVRSAANLSATPAKTPLALYCHLLSRVRGARGPLGESLDRFDDAVSRLELSAEADPHL